MRVDFPGFWLAMAGLAFAAAVMLFGCAPSRTVAYDPATMRCREFRGEVFVGPFLPSSECAGQPTPHPIPEPE